MKPATLVDVLRPYRHEPVLAMTHIRTKLHDHVGELVKVGSCAEVLQGLVLEQADLFW